MPDTKPNQYTVYHNNFSICSIFVRSTLAFCKTPASGIPTEFTLIHTNIYKDEQLTENYLLNINPKGQVPAMTSPSLPEPMTDSLPITYHICELYPHLAPAEHKELSYRLLKELHAIQFLSVSFKPQQNRASGITIAVQKLLERDDISEKYRQALLFKADYHERTLVHALEPVPIALAERQTRDFLSQITELFAKYGGFWIFGDDVGPTALDAQTVAFVARLIDADRRDLVPKKILEYAEEVMKGKEWDVTMGGKPTLYGLWMQRQGNSH